MTKFVVYTIANLDLCEESDLHPTDKKCCKERP